MKEIFSTTEWEKTSELIRQTSSAMTIYTKEGEYILGELNLPFRNINKPDTTEGILFVPAKIDEIETVIVTKPIISIDKTSRIIQKAIEQLNMMAEKKDQYEELQTICSYLQSISLAKEINSLMQATAEFLVHKFKLANCTIKLKDKKHRYFETKTSTAYEEVEDIVHKQTKNSRVTSRIKKIQEDFSLENIEEVGQLPKAMFALPLSTEKKYIGTIFCYLDFLHNKKINHAELVAKEFAKNIAVITELQEAKVDAQTDTLTGLLNRSKLFPYLDKEISDNSREQKAISLLIFDIDDFKKYNDSYGHLAGDEVLKMIAEQVKKISAVTFRYGGEEFVTILGNISSIQTKEIAEKLRSDIETNCELTISIGCITCNNSNISSKRLIEEADKALYKAKSLGKNKVVQFVMVDKNLGVVDTTQA